MIQENIRSLASSFGWRADIEKEISNGRVDVLLTNDTQKVGVEVTVTNTEEYELKNILKCLNGGCTRVFLLCPDREKRKRMEERIRSTFTETQKDMIEVVSESEFTEWLMAQVKPKVTESRVAGYRVKVKYDPHKLPDTTKVLRSLRK